MLTTDANSTDRGEQTGSLGIISTDSLFLSLSQCSGSILVKRLAPSVQLWAKYKQTRNASVLRFESGAWGCSRPLGGVAAGVVLGLVVAVVSARGTGGFPDNTHPTTRASLASACPRRLRSRTTTATAAVAAAVVVVAAITSNSKPRARRADWLQRSAIG